MAILIPDRSSTRNGVKVNEYLLTNHNSNNIRMPQTNFKEIIGVTIHNTDWIVTAPDTTPAEQYTRATKNGNMDDVRVHFYVDDVCAWQNLPLTMSGWHAADGDGDGNRKTIAIECIMSPSYNTRDQKSEDNAARLVASLLDEYGFDISHLYTHQHWYGKKYCPAYILPHWQKFVDKVKGYMRGKGSETELYRIRKTWADSKTQVGAYTNMESAKKCCDANPGYSVYDKSGNKVYPNDGAVKYDGKEIFPNTGLRYLAKGMKGLDVKRLQQILFASGYSVGNCGDDGDFGTATENAVKNFQTDNKLTVDGVVGTDTFKKMWGI